jgi:hypothetical protein
MDFNPAVMQLRVQGLFQEYKQFLAKQEGNMWNYSMFEQY